MAPCARRSSSARTGTVRRVVPRVTHVGNARRRGVTQGSHHLHPVGRRRAIASCATWPHPEPTAGTEANPSCGSGAAAAERGGRRSPFDEAWRRHEETHWCGARRGGGGGVARAGARCDRRQRHADQHGLGEFADARGLRRRALRREQRRHGGVHRDPRVRRRGQPRSRGRPGRSCRRHPLWQPTLHRRLRPVGRRHVERVQRPARLHARRQRVDRLPEDRRSFPEATSAATRCRTWPRCARSSSRAPATRSAAARSRWSRRRRSAPAPDAELRRERHLGAVADAVPDAEHPRWLQQRRRQLVRPGAHAGADRRDRPADASRPRLARPGLRRRRRPTAPAAS